MLQQLYDEWLGHPEWWFNNDSIDEYLKVTYYHLLHESFRPSDKKESIALIILYDQVVRHVYRNDMDTINNYLMKGIEYSNHVYDTYKDFTTEEYCFIMLPFRHTNQLSYITFVINETVKRLDNDKSSLLRRFFKATFQKYKFDPNLVIKHTPSEDYRWNEETFQNILEYCPTQIQRSAQVEQLIVLPKQSYIVSLSGGVDSMLCAYLMKKQGYDITAVHINYNNRSVREEEFVRSWCQEMDISLYVRRITEIQRDPCMKHGFRDLYESYTKMIRLNTYKTVDKKPNVVLGHNQDDCFENILTNISKKSHYENLKGMSNESTIDGINFYRPLLDVPKSNIYMYARMYEIPYLQDSTPSWSQRGKIRDKVRPVMEQWNSLLIGGLLNISSALQNMDLLLDDMVKDAISKTQNNKLTFDHRGSPRERPHYITLPQFWDKYISKMFHVHISHKSLNIFVDKINKNDTCKVILNKQLACSLTSTTCLFIAN